MDVGSFLRELGLQQYEAAFRDNRIDVRVLPKLNAEDLRDLGVTLVGDRRLLLEAIVALREPTAPVGTGGANAVAAPIPAIGGASTAEAERRPLSVMFCDLIGSTALSSRLDPEDLREVIRAYQACVADTIRQFDGFIARYVGDGVLIYFGWPEARETDAERAVRAGLAVAASVSATLAGGKPLHVRIGIATGLVVIGEPIGSGDSRQQTAVGETPNLAARLQGLAGPDQVVIDAATRRQIGGLFEFEDLGPVDLKGLPGSVPAWRVLGEGAPESRFEALRPDTTPLVGRDEEMGAVAPALGAGEGGQRSRCADLCRTGRRQVPPRRGSGGAYQRRATHSTALFLLAAPSRQPTLSGNRADGASGRFPARGRAGSRPGQTASAARSYRPVGGRRGVNCGHALAAISGSRAIARCHATAQKGQDVRGPTTAGRRSLAAASVADTVR
jgi:class 3 adenylate cyclase